MTSRPLSQLRTTPTHSSPTTAQGTLDFGRYSDDQLMAERERRQRQRSELSLHTDAEPAAHTALASIDREVERINDELIRRARSRHPSSFRRVS